MRIALINPPTSAEDQGALLEPLGLCYLAAVARAAGHEVLLWDLVDTDRADIGALFAALDTFRPELAGFTAMTNAFGRALALAAAVKARHGCRTVFGGWHVSGETESVLEPAVDFVVVGEGEATFLELLAHLEGRGPAREAILGLAWKDAGGHRVNAPRPRLRDLGMLPRPDLRGLPIDAYRMPAMLTAPRGRMRTLTVQASRGCPYACTFCQTPAVLGRLWRHRDASSVVDEIQALSEEHGIESLWVRDEEFTVNRAFVLAICAELTRRGLERRLQWGSFARVDDVDRELLTALKAAGYVYGFLGIDAGDREVRARLRKDYEDAEAERALALFHELDVTSHCGWIIGFPWDTREGLERQFAWIRTLPIDLLSVMFAMPFAGTEFGRDVRAQGLLVPGLAWDDWTEKRPLLRVPAIPPAELAGLRPRFLRRFYLRWGYARRLARRVWLRPARAHIYGSVLWHALRRTRYFARGDATAPAPFEVPARWAEPLHPVPGAAATG